MSVCCCQIYPLNFPTDRLPDNYVEAYEDQIVNTKIIELDDKAMTSTSSRKPSQQNQKNSVITVEKQYEQCDDSLPQNNGMQTFIQPQHDDNGVSMKSPNGIVLSSTVPDLKVKDKVLDASTSVSTSNIDILVINTDFDNFPLSQPSSPVENDTKKIEQEDDVRDVELTISNAPSKSKSKTSSPVVTPPVVSTQPPSMINLLKDKPYSELRSLCQSHKLKTKGKKVELLERLEEFYKKNNL